ncbi:MULTISPECIES: hypothetical protein [Spirulina sp. CCY15215]|uniref:hypothetical protein n=1 Tax=Spirulina sp. CCY15215 TaxID=2767591 RepID=UPI00194EF0A2|nr:hypothetical protein [Spirulina major]
MTDINKLINQLAAEEDQLRDREFLAPCVGGGKVRTAIGNIIYTFETRPRDFEGWGIFLPIDRQVAEAIDEPNLPQLATYLQLLKPFRLRLLYPLRGQTWLAYPVNESDMKQRFGIVKPIPVHLVNDGGQLESIIARVDGKICWFDEGDRRADPQTGEQLREALRQETPPDSLHFAGMTPEMQTAYNIAWQRSEAGQRQIQHRQAVQETRQNRRSPRQRPRDRRRDRNPTQPITENGENRLREALQQGGGQLEHFRDRGEYWQVEWRTANGELHSSAIDKLDLTVVSSGVCLSGRDRDFDLQSLVGVMRYEG